MGSVIGSSLNLYYTVELIQYWIYLKIQVPQVELLRKILRPTDVSRRIAVTEFQKYEKMGGLGIIIIVQIDEFICRSNIKPTYNYSRYNTITV